LTSISQHRNQPPLPQTKHETPAAFIAADKLATATMNPDPALTKAAQEKLDAHVREIVRWHFSPETGCPFWLDWAKTAGWNPAVEVKGFADLLRFPHFQDEWLRDLPNEVWVPKQYQGRPFNIFETGGTTGMPKQRIGWEDYKVDYSEFSEKLSDAHFPRGRHWLMVGPTGPRRLRLAVEHLANVRGSSCYFVDLDPRWVKKVISNKHFDQAKAYMEHVVDQAVTILKHRKISGMFTTPKLLEALGEKINLYDAGIRGVFCGGTTMAPQYTRFIVEEVLENRIGFYPTYGNTLMGLAASVPLRPEDKYSITYYAPQPRAVLRVVDPDHTEKLKNYGEWGRVELTTLTREFFMPRFMERDEAIRREPRAPYAWDGVAEVRPFGAMEKTIVEGVY
jgi:phenylacetate-coenzyme A ligase PaaK-like adenylate-forming protein